MHVFWKLIRLWSDITINANQSTILLSFLSNLLLFWIYSNSFIAANLHYFLHLLQIYMKLSNLFYLFSITFTHFAELVLFFRLLQANKLAYQLSVYVCIPALLIPNCIFIYYFLLPYTYQPPYTISRNWLSKII